MMGFPIYSIPQKSQSSPYLFWIFWIDMSKVKIELQEYYIIQHLHRLQEHVWIVYLSKVKNITT